MPRMFSVLLSALLIVAGAQAATINSTWTMNNAPVTIGSSVGVTGTVTLSNIGSGQFTTTISLTSVGNDGNITAPFTITLTGGAGTITGTLKVPLTLITGATPTATGSVTVTGGTYAGGVTGGSFAALNCSVSGGLATQNLALTVNGSGTVVTSGSGGGTGGGGGTPTPTITAVQDAGSYTANIAQGSIFVVKGSNLSASGYTAFNFPLPTQSTGSDKAQITFTPTAGGSGTQAYLIYTYNQSGVNQLAAILPSTVNPGTYNVTVTASGATSAPFQVTVVSQKAELFTGDASGSGLALLQNVVSATQYDINRFTTGTVGGATISPAKPGEYMVAYSTGMGPVTGGDNVGSAGVDETSKANVQVIVGGTSIPAIYVGRVAGLAGLDQINFQLPGNVATGCTVSFQISAGGKLSAPTFLAIAPTSSATACVQPGYTTQQLQDFDNGKTITAGGFTLSQLQESVPSFGSVKIDSISGGFTQITGFQLQSAGQFNVSSSTSGACTVTHVTGTSSQVSSGGIVNGLDAGTVTFKGPNISGLTVTQDQTTKSYSLSLGTEGISIPGQTSVTIGAGTYTISGAGGKDVGSFNASLTLGAPLTVSGGLPSNVVRSNNLTINWTGGNSSDPVQIIGYSGTTSGSGASATIDATEFVCNTTAGPGTFTVPSSILSQLPAANNSNNTTGFLEVTSGPTPTAFTPALTAGGSVSATFSALIGTGALVTYQ